jgi:N-acetylmuramoyl-L-alanine amidase
MRRTSSLPLVLALLVGLIAPAAVAAQTPDELLQLEVTGSPLVATREGARVGIALTTTEPLELRLRVTDFDGRQVLELFSGSREAGTIQRTWRGRDAAGEIVADGPYRVVVSATREDGETLRAVEWVTVAGRKVYPRRPGFITVALDPGHGGRLSGAVGPDGTREADINLDIGLRLARMLEAAGVNVVITRTTDQFVNTPEVERTGDGVIDDDDELAARPDLANEARADLFISIHNNFAVNTSVGGPSTFYYDERPFGPRSARLARIIQGEMMAALSDIGPTGYEPYDHGSLVYPYYVLRGYDPPRLNRPTQMPGVLSEGMFLSNPRELRYLQRPVVRQAMADAYYDAISKYLSRRADHVGYEVVAAPTTPVPAGDPASFEVRVRNPGNEELRGWRLVAGAVGRQTPYAGRVRAGQELGSARIPRLAPGEQAVVTLEGTAPEDGGEWTVLFDAVDRDGRRASRIGSPALQVPFETTDPPEPSPSLDASSDPAVDPASDGAGTEPDPPAG